MRDDRRHKTLVDFLATAWAYSRAGGDLSALISKANHTGVMVAFYLPRKANETLQALVGSNGADPERLHLTLAYLGDMNESALDQRRRGLIIEALQDFAAGAQPIRGSVGGLGRFNNAEEDGTNALCVLFDAPRLLEWRQTLIETIETTNTIVSRDHGFIPHITLKYIKEDELTPSISIPRLKIAFDVLMLAWGDELVPFELQGDGPRE